MNPLYYDGRADTVASEFHAQKAAILGNADLTAEAKDRMLRQAFSNADARLKALYKAKHEAIDSRRHDLGIRLFGTHGKDRDARDRAAALTEPAQAAQMMATARADGDSELMKAVAGQAWQRAAANPLDGHHWAGIVDGWLNDHSHLRSDAEELASLTPTARDGLAENLRYALARPSEITFGDLPAPQGVAAV